MIDRELRARLRTVPATALGGAAFITWGLVPTLAGLDRVLELLAQAWVW